MHPEASRELFDTAVGQLRDNHVLLRERSWLILDATFPTLRIAAFHPQRKVLRVFEFNADDWNDTPLALRLVDGETGEPLPGNLWPRDGSHWHPSGWTSAAGIATPQPFMCMKGIREYHTHQSHIGDAWDNYKQLDDFTLGNVISQVMDVFEKSDV